MDLLPRFCVTGELSKEEFARRLNSAGSDEVSELRVALFEEAVCKNLVDDGNILVRRIKCGGKTVKGKHIEDVWSLVCSIKKNEAVPRVILRNGKRSREEFQQSQVRWRSKQKHRRDECAGWLQGDAYAGDDVADGTEVCGPADGGPDDHDHVGITVRGVPEDVSCTSSGTLERLDTQVSAADSAFKSAVLSDINSLKSSVAEINVCFEQLGLVKVKLSLTPVSYMCV